MDWKRSDRPIREQDDVQASKRLRDHMNLYDPTDDPAGWQISGTGTVWTEIVAYPSTDAERVTQVVALTPHMLLLVVPSDVPGVATVQEFMTLSGAYAWWEGLR